MIHSRFAIREEYDNLQAAVAAMAAGGSAEETAGEEAERFANAVSAVCFGIVREAYRQPDIASLKSQLLPLLAEVDRLVEEFSAAVQARAA